jgi:hypothetical protein
LQTGSPGWRYMGSDLTEVMGWRTRIAAGN